MSFDHNLMAHGAAKVLLNQLQNGRAGWSTPRLTNRTTYWQSMADWPRPDSAFEDRSTGASMAIEFKPPGQVKREYVTGLGQALTYLRSFEYSAMVVPERAGDGFHIAAYLRDALVESFARNLPMALFCYQKDPSEDSDLRPLINLRPRPDPGPRIPHGRRNVFWAYWRDLSQHDAFFLLRQMDSSTGRVFPAAYRRFWNARMSKGRALTWEERRRKARPIHAPGYSGEQLNASLSLRHIGVLSSENTLTEEGLKLLGLGKIYGPSSVAFTKYLTQLILENGRHIELIFWLEEQQRGMPAASKTTADGFYSALDIRLQEAGVIATAPIGRPKATFLRDEQKLWNKLGLLVHSTHASYFHPDHGLVFNWQAIVSALRE